MNTANEYIHEILKVDIQQYYSSNDLDNNKAVGLDGINTEFYKWCLDD